MSSDRPALPAPVVPSSGRRVRWSTAFAGTTVVSLVTVAALITGALVGYRTAYEGRILPGVHVGGTDMSGLDSAGAAEALATAYGALGEGRVVLATGGGAATVSYADARRGPDVEAMVAAAMAVGRDGDDLEQAVALARVALEGIAVEPVVSVDEDALDKAVSLALSRLQLAPVDATIRMGPDGPVTTRAHPGRRFDVPGAQAAALATLRRLDAPADVVIDVPAIPVAAERGDDLVAVAAARAERMVADVVVTFGDRSWTVPAATVRTWINFEDAFEGAVRPAVDRDRIIPVLADVAKAVRKAPVSATFLTGRSGAIVGVKAGRDGRRLDDAATAASIERELAHRLVGRAPAPVAAAVAAIEPELTSAEAEKIAPRMVRLSRWTTWFPIGERNAWGANIWLPARFINGTVLQPGERFEWFRAVGPITPARGFGFGGVIKGDHSEPTGAMGGGMCSSSTTLFNAALRAGLKMGARANHTYYIDRYPLGLDATVWAESWGRQTMSFTNDMKTPVLIRGFKIVGKGGVGYVRYEIWGVDDGRRVSISRPTVKNVVQPGTREDEVTTLPPGVREQTEWPMQGMDVWVTRVVRDRDGHAVRRDTFYSHYKVWEGVIQVGERR